MTIEAFVKELVDSTEYQSLFKSPKTCGMHAGRVYLKGGDECGQHSTLDREEMLVFLAGKGQAVIGEDKTIEVGTGKVLYIPPQTPHNVKNVSAEPLIYIFCVVPVTSNGGNEHVGH